MIRPKTLALTCALAGSTLASPACVHAQMHYPPPPYRYDVSASLRLDVEPEQTEVFIDGYWAGIVDDFDGFLQQLHLEPGEHEIELFLEGHRSFRQKLYLQPHRTFTIRHEIKPLGPGETPDSRPKPPAKPERKPPHASAPVTRAPGA